MSEERRIEPELSTAQHARNADGAGKPVERIRRELDRLPGRTHGQAERRRRNGKGEICLSRRWGSHRNDHRSSMGEAA